MEFFKLNFLKHKLQIKYSILIELTYIRVFVINNILKYDLNILIVDLEFSSHRPNGPIRSSSRNVRVSVCLSDVPFDVVYFEAYFAPTS